MHRLWLTDWTKQKERRHDALFYIWWMYTCWHLCVRAACNKPVIMSAQAIREVWDNQTCLFWSRFSFRSICTLVHHSLGHARLHYGYICICFHLCCFVFGRLPCLTPIATVQWWKFGVWLPLAASFAHSFSRPLLANMLSLCYRGQLVVWACKGALKLLFCCLFLPARSAGREIGSKNGLYR